MIPMRIVFFLAALLLPATAHAYIGPGAGITAIGSVLALLGAVILAIIGLVWYPMKRMLKARKKSQADAANAKGEASD